MGVLLDMDRGTVSFVKDGDDFNVGRPVVVNMGIAYHHLRRVGRGDASGRHGLAMYPCFGVKSAGDQMTVLGQKWLSRRGLGHARRVRQAVDAIVAARELRRSLEFGCTPPASLAEGARRRYRGWKRRRFSSYPSRAGVMCEVDVTRAALHQAAGGVADAFGGIHVGQRVDTPYGEGTVIGSHRGDVWFSLDGDDSGAWYWTRDELSDLLNSARLRLLGGSEEGDVGNAVVVDDSGSAEQKEGGVVDAGATEEEATVELAATSVTPNPQGEISSGPTLSGPTSGGRRDFAALATQGWGSLALDEALVRLSNVVAARRGVPTSHLSTAELAAAADAAGPGLSTSALAGMSADKLGARLLLLVELNARLALALPLLDFARESRAPLAVTKSDVRRAAAVPGVTVGVRSPSGAAVADLRGLLFTQMKVNFWLIRPHLMLLKR